MEKHVCNMPKTATPGDIYNCPICKRHWRAESDGLGSLYIWWVTTDLGWKK